MIDFMVDNCNSFLWLIIVILFSILNFLKFFALDFIVSSVTHYCKYMHIDNLMID